MNKKKSRGRSDFKTVNIKTVFACMGRGSDLEIQI